MQSSRSDLPSQPEMANSRGHYRTREPRILRRRSAPRPGEVSPRGSRVAAPDWQAMDTAAEAAATFGGLTRADRWPRIAEGEEAARGNRYSLDRGGLDAGTRLDVQSTLFNPVTFRHIQALGIAPSWRCWEVGAGGPSVPAWLATRVGRSGHVVATDIDTSWMSPGGHAGFEVLRHDVATEPPPADGFDLVHARLVLVYVRDRATALRTMVSALRPGGWLLIEESDPALQTLVCPDEHGPAEQLANKLRYAVRTLAAQCGVDLAYGRTLPRLLREAGLTQVAADAFFPIGGTDARLLERTTVAQVRDRLVDAGLASNREIDQHLDNLSDDELDLATSPMISVWGRRPG